MNERIDILMITHNRPNYTRLSLRCLLDSCDRNMRVWLWHNGLHAPTLEIVRELSRHPRVYRFHESPVNVKLREPMNWVMGEGDGAYFAKVDDDCVVHEGWHRPLVAALRADPGLGVAACWHFQESDFDVQAAAPKIREYTNGIRIMLNPWVQGSGFMMKRECIDECGLIPSTVRSFTPYCWILFEHGWRLGWPLPLVQIDHMDDPRSLNSRFKTEEDFLRNPPLGATFGDVRSLAEWKERVRWLAREVIEAPLEPRAYTGWRSLAIRVRRRIERMLGLWPPWRVAARKSVR